METSMHRFAAAYVQPSGSPIRELLGVARRPGMISFAGGHPSASLFDTEGLRQAAAATLSEPANALQYGATEGDPALRQALAAVCAGRGIARPAGDILVTSGSQQALDLLLRVLVEPGDCVLVETPAYPATLQALRLAGARIIDVPVDGEGLCVDQIESLVRAHRPKLLYTVPTFSNPSGLSLALPRRERLVDLAVALRLTVVEDDPYGDLGFEPAARPALSALAAQRYGDDHPLVYLSSLSKTVAPALRIGWMIADAELLRRCAIAKQTADLCGSALTQSIAARYLAGGRGAAALTRMRQVYAQRMRTMVDQLTDQLGATWRVQVPQGGMFVWAHTGGAVDARTLLEHSLAHGVVFVPGDAFYANIADRNTLRLSFAAVDDAMIVEGVTRLAQACRSAERALSNPPHEAPPP